MTKDEALALALEALENSVDLVREDAYNAEKLYGNYPSRQGKVAGLKVLADDHEKAITAIKQALALDKMADNARELGLDYEPDYKVTVVDNQHPNGVPLEQWGRVSEQGEERMKQLIEDLISAMEYHVEQTRPIHSTTVALQAAREALKSMSAPLACDCKQGQVCGVCDPITPPAQPAPVQEPVATLFGSLPVYDTTPPAHPPVPDALTSADIQEHIEYVAGWNDCRQTMLEMMK
jgi:tetratricopeptide (TPR) repeat protein